MNSIYDLGSSIYNYFYPPQESQKVVYPPQKSRETVFPPQESQEVIAEREKASKIENIQKKLSDLRQESFFSSSLRSYMQDKKTFILENLSKFKGQFLETNFYYSHDRFEYIKFLISEGFIQADDYRIIDYSQNFTLSSKFKLTQLVLNKKEESNSLKLYTPWSQYIEGVFIKVLETYCNSYYSPDEVNLSKALELLGMVINKAGSLEKFFGPYSVFPKRFSSLVNQLASSDRVRSSLWWGSSFSDSFYPILSFALDSGVEITPDNAMKLFSYRNNISSSSANILALYEDLTDKYLSKQDRISLKKLAINAVEQKNLCFFKKIIQCDRLREGTKSYFFDEILEKILRDYSSYSSYNFLDAFFEFLNPTLDSTQYDRLIDIVVDGLVMSLESEYDYNRAQKARDVCKLLSIHVIYDFDQLEQFCCSIGEKLGEQLTSKENRHRVGYLISERFYQYLPSKPFKIDSNTQENSLEDFFKHPLIQEVLRANNDPKSIVYRAFLIGVLSENPSGLGYFMGKSLSGDASKGKAISESKVKVIEFIDALAKFALPVCSSLYDSSFIGELISELIDEEFFTVEELGAILVNLNNPLLYAHYLHSLSDEVEEKLINKLPIDSTYDEVRKQVEVVLAQYHVDFSLFAKAESLLAHYPIDQFSSYKVAKEYILNGTSESIYEVLREKIEQKRRIDFSSIKYTFNEMISDLEEDRYERICQFLQSKTYSYPPFDLNHSEGEQLVFKAIEKNNILVVKQLVELGYNLDKTYEQKLTAVEYAKEQGRSSWFVRYLESCISKSE